MTSEPTYAELHQFAHRVEHLRRRKGLALMPEASWIAECWGVIYGVPDWAIASAEAGESGTRWCPILNPTLYEKAGHSRPHYLPET